MSCESWVNPGTSFATLYMQKEMEAIIKQKHFKKNKINIIPRYLKEDVYIYLFLSVSSTSVAFLVSFAISV